MKQEKNQSLFQSESWYNSSGIDFSMQNAELKSFHMFSTAPNSFNNHQQPSTAISNHQQPSSTNFGTFNVQNDTCRPSDASLCQQSVETDWWYHSVLACAGSVHFHSESSSSATWYHVISLSICFSQNAFFSNSSRQLRLWCMCAFPSRWWTFMNWTRDCHQWNTNWKPSASPSRCFRHIQTTLRSDAPLYGLFTFILLSYPDPVASKSRHWRLAKRRADPCFILLSGPGLVRSKMNLTGSR